MVALRKESVDRNHVRDTTSTRPRVALRKESVDRNWGTSITLSIIVMSLSARRAWIEILFVFFLLSAVFVALRKESVDRN